MTTVLKLAKLELEAIWTEPDHDENSVTSFVVGKLLQVEGMGIALLDDRATGYLGELKRIARVKDCKLEGHPTSVKLRG